MLTIKQGERWQILKPSWVSVSLLVIVSFLIFQPIARFVVYQQVDYATHLSYLQPSMDMRDIGQVLSMFPHFLYHLAVYFIYRLFALPTISDAGVVVSLAAYTIGSLVTYWLIVKLLGKPKSYKSGLLYISMTLGLMLLMPIDIFTPENLFVGYIGISAYHNPTIVLLKPAAIVVFWCAMTVFEQPASDHNRRRSVPIGVCALVTIICILAKANYVIAFIPALMLCAAYRGLQRKEVDWMLLIWGVVLPTFLTLGVQIATFQSSTGFIFAPLAVIYSWTRINPDAPVGWPLKFFLSILFPLLVYLIYFKTAIQDRYLNLAWLAFAFGAAYMYLLAEGGERLSHANFTWSAISTLFILFIVSAAFLIQQIRAKSNGVASTGWLDWRVSVCGIVFGLHVVSGLYWYYIHLTALNMGDIIATKW